MNGQRQLGWLVAGVAVIGFGAGCGGSSEPGTGAPADPLASAAALNNVGAAFNVQTIQSLSNLSNNFNYAGLSSPIPAQTRAMLQVIRPRRDLVRQPYAVDFARAQQLRRLIPVLSAGRAPIPGIQAHLGEVFTFDGNTGLYSSTATGGPTNGVRIMLYAIDPLTGNIAVGTGGSVTEIGYVDLTDEGSGATHALGVKVVGTVGTPVTYADYGVEVTPGTNSFTAGTRPGGPNYVTDGTVRVDFTAGISANGTTHRISVDGSLTVNNPAVTVASSITVDFSDLNAVVADASFSFSHNGETGSLVLHAVIDGNGDLVSASATVRVNGRTFATITKTAGNQAVVTGPGGRQLTGNEEQYVESIFEAPGDVFDAIGGLCEPGLEVTGQDTSMFDI